MNHFYFLLEQRRNSLFVNCNVFLNEYSLQSTELKMPRYEFLQIILVSVCHFA